MNISYGKWVKSTYQNCDDPTEWNGDNPICNIEDCEKEVEYDDEYCEDHQRCCYCGEREECEDSGDNCKEEI